MKNFWEKLAEKAQADGTRVPIMALAPMANVTDAAFRRIIAKYGKPDVMWTEFVSADGLCSAGKKALLRDLEFSENERPIVAQLFTGHPDKMYEAAKLVAELGFDGLDINMGCPDRSVEKQCAGAAMMRDPELAVKVIEAAQKGVKDAADVAGKDSRPIPISVKTRLGYNKVEIETWIPTLLSTGIAALTIHARTRKEMSDVPAQWQHVKRAVEIRDSMLDKLPTRTLILGNGDATDLADAKAKVDETGADGVMFGRAIFGNPWLCSGKKPSMKEKLDVLVEHTALFEKLLGDIKSFAIMKKHFKAYVNGWDGAKELRMKLMETESAKEVENIIQQYLKKP